VCEIALFHTLFISLCQQRTYTYKDNGAKSLAYLINTKTLE